MSQTKNRKHRKIVMFLVKYCLFVLPVFSITADFILYSTIDNYGFSNPEKLIIITAMLPMIFTVIVLFMNLASDNLYLETRTDLLQKYRKDFHFSFVEMTIISILLMAAASFISAFNLALSSWIIELIAIIYSTWMIIDLIPLLMKNDKKLTKCIKNTLIIEREEDNSFLKEYASFSEDMRAVVQNKVLIEGIEKTFFELQNDEIPDDELLEFLLNCQIIFLYNASGKGAYLSKYGKLPNKSLDPLVANDVGLKNIEVFFIGSSMNMFYPWNIIKSRHYAHYLVRSAIYLKSISYSLGLISDFEKEMRRISKAIIEDSSYRSELEKKNCENTFFIYHLLIYSISENRLWFLKAIRDGSLNGDLETLSQRYYFHFISFYLYFLIDIDKFVPDNFKQALINFINEKTKGIHSCGETFSDIYKHEFRYVDSFEWASYLPIFIKMYQSLNTKTWYRIDTNEYDFYNLFDEELIINLWIWSFVVIRTRENIDELEEDDVSKKEVDDYNDEIVSSLTDLPNSSKQIFYESIGNYWFNDDLKKEPNKYNICRIFGYKPELRVNVFAFKPLISLSNKFLFQTLDNRKQPIDYINLNSHVIELLKLDSLFGPIDDGEFLEINKTILVKKNGDDSYLLGEDIVQITRIFLGNKIIERYKTYQNIKDTHSEIFDVYGPTKKYKNKHPNALDDRISNYFRTRNEDTTIYWNDDAIKMDLLSCEIKPIAELSDEVLKNTIHNENRLFCIDYFFKEKFIYFNKNDALKNSKKLYEGISIRIKLKIKLDLDEIFVDL